MNTITKQMAIRTGLGRDLFWSLMTKDGEIRWKGYNDVHWWRNVAMDDGFRLVKTHDGTRYTLHPGTNEVLIEEAS